MSELTMNLVPDKSFPVGQFMNSVKNCFEKLKIIDGYYNEELNWYNAGPDSNIMFADTPEIHAPAFEYVEIHDTINKRIIPLEDLNGVYGAACKNCKTNIDESLSDILDDLSDFEFDHDKEIDMSLLKINCPSCGYVNPIEEIAFKSGAVLSNQFICFVDIYENINKITLENLSAELNCNFKVIYGRI